MLLARSDTRVYLARRISYLSFFTYCRIKLSYEAWEKTHFKFINGKSILPTQYYRLVAAILMPTAA